MLKRLKSKLFADIFLSASKSAIVMFISSRTFENSSLVPSISSDITAKSFIYDPSFFIFIYKNTHNL